MLMLNNLKKIEGATKNTKRIGRGQGSGQGTQAGKGHKGQKARKSGHVRTGFIGGTMPLYMRLPKVGFKNAENKTLVHSISLSRLEKFASVSEVITKEFLVENGLVKGLNKSKLIKFIDSESYSKGFSFKSEDFLFSSGAKTKIEKNTGKIL